MDRKHINIIILTVLGFFGIFFHLPLFFGVDFLFGSIFSLIILMIYGTRWGVVSSVTVSSYTMVLWGHPYAWLILSLEVLVTGLIKRQTRRNLIWCNIIFWLFIGVPLAFFCYKYLLRIDDATTYLILLKQSSNGILNALAANVILIVSTKFVKKPPFFSYSFRESLFSMIMTLVCIPLMTLMVLDGRAYMEQAQASISSELKNLSSNINQHMISWFEHHLFAVNQLAAVSVEDIRENNLNNLQNNTESTTKLFSNFHNMYIADRSATTIAFYPMINDKGESTIGLNFSDREYFKQLKSKKEPVVSDVFLGRGGVFTPIITISSPILNNNEFMGYTLAALNLEKVSEIIKHYSKKAPYNLTLTDKNNNLIATTLEHLSPVTPYDFKQKYPTREFGDELYRISRQGDEDLKVTAHIGAHYVFESQISPFLKWNLIAEYPVALQQEELFKVYTKYFSIVLVLILISALLIGLISKELSDPLIKLAESTTHISNIAQFKPHSRIMLPGSSIGEVQKLTDNFQKMAHIIEHNFQALKESEEKHRLAMDATTDGLWDWNIEKEEVYFSPSWAKIIGKKSVDQVYGTWLDRIHPEDKQEVLSALQTHLDGNSAQWQKSHRLKSSREGWKWVLGRGRVVERSDSGQACRMVGTMIDITRTKKMEQQLKESEQRYREYFEEDFSGSYISTPEGQLLTCNKEYLRIFGFKTLDQAIHTPIENNYEHPESRLEFIEKIKKQKRILNTEFQFRKVDGTLVTATENASGVFDENGKLTSIRGFLLDITDLKSAREEEKQSKSLLEAALEATADGILIVDKHGKWTGYNQNFINLWGIPERVYHTHNDAEAVSYVLDKIIEKDGFLKRIEELYQNEEMQSFDVIALKDGRTVERYSKPQIQDDTIVGRVWCFRDVTERIESERKILESEEFYREFFDNSPTALYLQDFSLALEQVTRLIEDGVKDLASHFKSAPAEAEKLIRNISVKEVNQAAVDLYKAGTPEKLKQSLYQVIKFGDHDHTIKQVIDFANGINWYEGEARNLDLMGNTLNIILRKTVINRKENGLSKVLVSIVDVTDLHRVHNEKRELEKQLHQTQKMETIGTLAGGIAHDFNNILYPILGHSELLLEDVDQNSFLRQSIEEINTSALRAKDLVKQILTFSRQEKGEVKLMKLQPILKEALKMLRSTIPATIEIRQDIEVEGGIIKADPTQMHQLVMNILTNAYQSINTAGTINVKLSKQYLTPGLLPREDMKPGQYNCLVISDTGSGMDAHTQERIFEPFFTTKERGKGTGMGLSVVHGIISKLNGGIRIDSQPGAGTSVSIYLPLQERLSKSEDFKDSDTVQGGTEHILLVDDEQAVLALESQILERLGYRVDAYQSSFDALEAFKGNPDGFDLLITDMTMPKMTGAQLASEIFSLRSNMPIIILTGYSETINQEQADLIGIKGFLMKPVIQSELARMVRKIIDHPN